ncbi:MAG: hypothetical protein ABIG28_01870 [archaeon]
MAETITTGGVKTFRYQKGHNPRFNKEQKLEIQKAYAQAEERKKKKKKKKKIIILAIIVLIIISIILGVSFI